MKDTYKKIKEPDEFLKKLPKKVRELIDQYRINQEKNTGIYYENGGFCNADPVQVWTVPDGRKFIEMRLTFGIQNDVQNSPALDVSEIWMSEEGIFYTEDEVLELTCEE